jgi:hypothetical protein
MKDEEILERAKKIEQAEKQKRLETFLEEYHKLEKTFGFTFSSAPYLENGIILSDLIIKEYKDKGEI